MVKIAYGLHFEIQTAIHVVVRACFAEPCESLESFLLWDDAYSTEMLHQGLSLAAKGLEVTNLFPLLDSSWCILSITAAIGKEHFSLLAAQFPWDCKEAELEESWRGRWRTRGEQRRAAESC